MFGFGTSNELRNRWHPDFRIPEHLPDTKIVRTRFIVNLCFVALFCVIGAILGYREIIRMGLHQSIEAYEAEIDQRSGGNRQLAIMSGQFRRLVNQFEDIRRFHDQSVDPLKLLIGLSEARSDNVVFDRVGFENRWDPENEREVYQVRLVGKGRTTADIGELKESLTALELREGYTIAVSEEGNPAKDAQTGTFSFIIVLTIAEDQHGTE